MYIPFWLFPYLSHIKKKEIFIMRKEQITVTNNSVCNSAENKGLEGKGMKRRLLHFKKRMVPAVSGALMGVMLMSTTCFSAGTGTSAVTQSLISFRCSQFHIFHMMCQFFHLLFRFTGHQCQISSCFGRVSHIDQFVFHFFR